MARKRKPRALTPDEVGDALVDRIWEYVDGWHNERNKTTRDMLSGLAFSILALLDGADPDLPDFKVSPTPASDDKKYRIERGLDWFPTDEPDVAGSLHKRFQERNPDQARLGRSTTRRGS